MDFLAIMIMLGIVCSIPVILVWYLTELKKKVKVDYEVAPKQWKRMMAEVKDNEVIIGERKWRIDNTPVEIVSTVLGSMRFLRLSPSSSEPLTTFNRETPVDPSVYANTTSASDIKALFTAGDSDELKAERKRLMLLSIGAGIGIAVIIILIFVLPSFTEQYPQMMEQCNSLIQTTLNISNNIDPTPIIV